MFAKLNELKRPQTEQNTEEKKMVTVGDWLKRAIGQEPHTI